MSKRYVKPLPVKYSDVMVDVESLGTSMSSVILCIAAVKFNLQGGIDKQAFYRKILQSSCQQVGMTTDQSTVEWWNKQDPEIKKEVFSETDRVELRTALQEFSEWYGDDTNVAWCQGLNFDIPLLAEAYRRVGLQPPWKFWLTRDTRTVFALHNFDYNAFRKDKLKHHPLHDCKAQIAGLHQCLSQKCLTKSV